MVAAVQLSKISLFMDKINLFCLPFAGGNVYSYRGYAAYAPAHINLVPIELPGRGARIREPLLTDIHLMVEDVYGQVRDQLHRPFAIYGHSMGSLLAYLLTRRLVDEKRFLPEHLFLTGCVSPSSELYREDVPKYSLPKDAFVKKLKELGGSTDEVLNDKNLFDYIEPIIRADFKATETFRYEKPEPFDIPITVAIGLNERATYEQALRWEEETTAKVEVRQFPGRHFFIFDYPREIMEIISNKLKYKFSHEG